nr:probable glucan 1,3-alpha-glucosidase [Ipomoea batatas]
MCRFKSDSKSRKIVVTLDNVIALNSSQAAEGELYIDDGRSFDFKEGAYIHRRFIFSAGTLTSLNLTPSSGSKKYLSDCRVERIIVLGLSGGPNSALLHPGNNKVEVEKGRWLSQAKYCRSGSRRSLRTKFFGRAKLRSFQRCSH